MEETKKKSLTTAEIIILVVAIILLIAFIVTSVIVVGKKNDEIKAINQQLTELKEQVDGIVIPSGITSADVENAIAEAIKDIKIPEQGLTEEQVKAIVDAAIAGIVIPEGGLTEAEVKTIIEAAIAGIEVSEGGLSKAQVQAIVDAAIKGIKFPESGLTEAQVKKIVTDALKNVDTGLTKAEVEAIVKDVLAGLEEDVDKYTVEEKLAKGMNVVLTANHTLAYSVDVPVGSDIVFDLNGKTLTVPEGVRLAFFGKAIIEGEGAIIIEAGVNPDYEIEGIVVTDYSSVTFADLKLTVTKDSAHGITNEGTVVIDNCDFVVGKYSTGYSCLLYNEGKMNVVDSTFTEEGTPAGYAYGGPIHNKGILDMINVDIESVGFCTTSFGGRITIDSSSTLTLKGEKHLTPCGDYFAYNAHNFDEATANDCNEFKFLGEAEVNQINLEFKEVFANGGTIKLTKDEQVGSVFSAMNDVVVVIDLNGKTLKFNENSYFVISNSKVTFKNGTVIAETDSDDTLYAINVNYAGDLVLDGVTYISRAVEDNINNKGKLTVKNCDFSVADDYIGASLTLLSNHGVANISDSKFGNTAPDAKYTRCTPIDNYGELTMTRVEVNSISNCIYFVGNGTKTVLVDCTLNHGENRSDFCTLAVNEGWLEDGLIVCTVDGVEKEVTIFYH